MGWADFGPIFEWGSNGFPASGPAARRLRHRGATRRLGVAARTPARRRLVGSWAPRARPRPRPSTGVISHLHGRTKQSAGPAAWREPGRPRRRRQHERACDRHMHTPARGSTNGNTRPPSSALNLSPPSVPVRTSDLPVVSPWTRPGKGKRERGTRRSSVGRADLPGCCGVERRQLNRGGGGSGTGSVAGKPSPASCIQRRLTPTHARTGTTTTNRRETAGIPACPLHAITPPAPHPPLPAVWGGRVAARRGPPRSQLELN